ncbi:MAG: T9SS type A sorting domain-containing protein [Flavobacteriales bacterium]|nr:T9SS type A sorting domain-containing protein [Flavobacteriales bacterium]
MKKNIIYPAICLSLMFAPTCMSAQAVVTSECIGTPEMEVPSSIHPTSDGGFIVVGLCAPIDGIVSPTSHGGMDFYVAKLNVEGGMEWQHNYGGSDDEIATGIAELPSGEYVITGKSFSDDGDVIDHTGSTFTSDIWCIRISPIGELLWSKSFGTEGNDSGADIIYKNPNRLILGGTMKIEGSGVGSIPENTDIWIAELDINGNVIQEEFYGDDSRQELFDMLRTPDNELYISGTTYSAAENTSDGAAMLTKIDGNGDEDWSISFESDGMNGIGQSSRLCLDADENIIMGFQTSLQNDNVNCNAHGSFHFVSVSENGELLNQKCFGGGGMDKSIAASMTSDGSIWVLGSTSSDDGDVDPLEFDSYENAWLARLDEDMNIDWKITLGGSSNDGAVDMCVQNGTTLFILGFTTSTDGIVAGLHNQYGDYADNWVVKIDTEAEGVHESSFNNIGVYPNPATDQVRVILDIASPFYQYEIFNQTGALVKTGRIDSHSDQISLTELSSGIYQLHLSDSGGRKMGSGRLVKS